MRVRYNNSSRQSKLREVLTSSGASLRRLVFMVAVGGRFFFFFLKSLGSMLLELLVELNYGNRTRLKRSKAFLLQT